MPEPTVDGIMELVEEFGKHVYNAQFLWAQFDKGICDYATQRMEEKAAEDMLPRIRAAVEALAPTWRPIAEAPRTGRPLIVSAADWTDSRVGSWDDEHQEWVPDGKRSHSFWTQPTHFMPLPTPPKEGE